MPTRSLRAKPAAADPPKDYKQAIAYHSSSITIFWILFLFLSLGFVSICLVQHAKIEMLMQDATALNAQFLKTQSTLINLQQKIQALQSAVPAETVTATSALPTHLAPLMGLPTAGPVYSGILKLGSFSPDGTKYAGYDLDTAGKFGIGVETMSDHKVRHIVLLNPKTEFTSQTVQVEQPTTVRWKDNRTIEYDVLSKTGKREVRTVKIGF
jgi:hypothetical protein